MPAASKEQLLVNKKRGQKRRRAPLCRLFWTNGPGIKLTMEVDISASGLAPKGQDPDYYAVLLEPAHGMGEQDEFYVATRRLLLAGKAADAKLKRQMWKCNGVSYVQYRDFQRYKKYGRQPTTSAWSDIPIRSHSRQGSLTPSSPGPPQMSPSGEDLRKNRGGSFSSLSRTISRRDSVSSTTSEASHTSSLSATKDEPAYSFVGMQCIFDDSKLPVNVIKFGRRSSDVLAYAGGDGVLRVCSVADPPRVILKLVGHTKEITDFDWSSNNEYLLSCSLDKTVRVWNATRGDCIRIVYGSSAQLCCCFNPVNNNLLFVGNASSEVSIINFSTGRVNHKASIDCPATAIDIDNTGRILFVGDNHGTVHSFAVDAHTGALRHAHRNVLPGGKWSPCSAIVFRSFSLLANGPVLLASIRDGTLRFFSVAAEVDGYLTPKVTLQLQPRARNIRASFCPLLSLEKGEFIVTGNEDTTVYFYDFIRPGRACVNKLMGHTAPVTDVSWNHGENFLASCDCDGVVIVWKRTKQATGKDVPTARMHAS
ncbi:hypothetical protein KFL_000820210 [Klebsormidium nitens]|uniref:Uncharacterized protein n=1 Tax=Klebsormidium nitens TaxID=105231 RepID=A0A1Y1HSA3_KLENI|nr:hypothetical protein KFL_000820210 [Klebsormidium nitens]|eukprot:GAQ81514.1 hypothetical protein KFL_000820210 [Klebsormidium nitens]